MSELLKLLGCERIIRLEVIAEAQSTLYLPKRLR